MALGLGLGIPFKRGSALSLGPELVSNTDFAGDVLTPWAQQSGLVTATGGRMRAARSAGSLGRGRYALSGLTIGASYLLTFDRFLGPGAVSGTVSITISATSTTGALATNTGGDGTGIQVPFTTTLLAPWIMMDSGAGVNGIYVEYDNVSVKRIL